MLTRKECESAYFNIYDPDFVEKEDIEVFWRLMNEHFNQKPLKFEDLEKDMWVWDNDFRICRQVHKFYNNGMNNVIQFKANQYPSLAEAYYFENDRFYPIKIPIL